jgi:hypothetical protein
LEGGTAVFEVGAGHYRFSADLPPSNRSERAS